MGQIQRFSNRIWQAVRAQRAGSERVLVVSEDRDDALGRLCGRLRLELKYAGNLAVALSNLRENDFAVVIYDHDISGQDWRAAVSTLAHASPGSSILLMSTLRQPEIWNEVVRKGGHDMLSKPISEEGAESTIALARARAKVNRMRRKIVKTSPQIGANQT